MENKTIVGIDPDVERSGYAVCVRKDGRTTCRAVSLTFDELIMELSSLCKEEAVEVVIEAGWMNQKASWHTSPWEKANIAAKKGLAVGRNHQVAHDIASLCKALAIPYREVAPLRKSWRGRDGKITEDELLYFCPMERRRDGHTHNQEERDAMLLAWVYAGGAVRIKPTQSTRK